MYNNILNKTNLKLNYYNSYKLELCISRCGECARCAIGDADGRDEWPERAPHLPVRPARSTPLLGQVVQGPERILPLRAPG